MTEQEMREAEVPWLETPEELSSYIAALVEQEHDYGTSAYAMSLAAVAAFQYVAKKLGTTGFQASCADMDVLRRTRGYENGFMILDANNLLYPQYDLPGEVREWIVETRFRLAPVARERLKSAMHPRVRKHMQQIADLERPVSEERSS